MIGLLQRVSQASVSVDGRVICAIGRGILVFACVQPADNRQSVDRLLARVLGYRVFPDQGGRMNLSVTDVGGDLLLVPQFTLAADTRKGSRPSFSSAASPQLGRELFEYLVSSARALHPAVSAGVFGADMQVALVNDGPVTFWLE